MCEPSDTNAPAGESADTEVDEGWQVGGGEGGKDKDVIVKDTEFSFKW